MSQTVCRAGQGTAVKGGQRSRANPEFLQEVETGAFLVEVKCGVGRFQKTGREAKSGLLGSK